MSKLQIGLIIALAAVLIALIVIFWGSVASAVFLLSLIMIPCQLLMKYHVAERDSTKFDEE